MSQTISASELANYKQQLKQVEAAIVLDPDNNELKKLAEDLKQVLFSICFSFLYSFFHFFNYFIFIFFKFSYVGHYSCRRIS